MKRLLFLTSIIFFALTACSHSEKPKPLPTTQQSQSVTKVWAKSSGAGSQNSYYSITPVIDQDVIYTAGVKGRVMATDIKTGRTLWTAKFRAPFSSQLSTDDNALYAGTSKGQLFKINKTNGKLVWVRNIDSAMIAAPAIKRNIVLAKTINSEITAYNNQNTHRLWEYQENQPSLVLRDASNPVFYGRNIIVGFPNGVLASISSTTGQPIWKQHINEPTGKTDVERMTDVDTTPIVKDGTIYTATYQGQLVAVEASSGNVLWQQPLSDYTNLATDRSSIYATDSHGVIWAFSQNDGHVLWKQKALAQRQLTSPTLAGNLLVIADADGFLHILSKQTGRYLTRMTVNASGITATPLTQQHNVYVLANDGSLYAYHLG
ncbi:MAG: outer membrane protein assembly factor BamB [Gammaproteobacteria bacterium]